MQRELLKLLADGRQHSGRDLAAALGITRAAIWKQVQLLRERGIAVAAQAGQGYSLALPLELLERDGIFAALPPDLRPVIDDLQVLWVAESTSDLLLQGGRTEPGRARICLAEYQTGGRGRRGRQWFAAVGSGVCISVGWCFPAAPASLSCLGLAAGGAVLSAHKTLCWFVLVGWAIYPIGYMAGTPGWYDSIFGGLNLDVVYNIGDVINKIGFGLVVYSLAVAKSE